MAHLERGSVGVGQGLDLGDGVRAALGNPRSAVRGRAWLAMRTSPAIARLSIAAFGILACAGVGYLTARNPAARPAHLAVLLRVSIIATLTVTAIYAQGAALQRRMGVLLAAGCAFSALWLLNGSANRFAFSVGVLFSAPALVVAYCLMLVHPSGRLGARDVWLVTVAGGVIVLLWTVATLISAQPPLKTPLLVCVGGCPRNGLLLGSGTSGLVDVLRVALRLAWAVVTVGGVMLLERRRRSATGPLRRSLLFVCIASWLAGVLLLGYLVAQRLGEHGAESALGTAYVVMWAAVPAAILAGLAAERLFMGQVLAGIVSRLAHDANADPGALMGDAFEDPSLSVSYTRPATGTYVDFSGAPVSDPDSVGDRAVAWVEHDGRRVAAVAFDPELADQRRFIQATVDAVGMRIEQAQLLADLKASTVDLAASRLRLMAAAQAERRRLERDLHDSVQQDLLGLRLKLELVGEAVGEDPAQGQRMIAAVGRQLDEVLGSLRSVARGIYPSLLRDHGLLEAVRSTARRCPARVSVRGKGIGRYPEDVEVAIYFCCLEGLQNVAKHGGAGAEAAVCFWHEAHALRFEIVDSGVGFRPGSRGCGNGLANMRDRIEAVGGTLTITSRSGEGTVIRGRVPVDAMLAPGDG